MIKRVLITGSTGFVGSNLVTVLSKQYRLYCLSRASGGSLNRDISYIEQDLREELDVSKLPDDVDCIVHLAASMDKTVSKSELFQINTVSTLNLLEYGKSIGIKKFVFASTGGVYGYGTKPHDETSPINPVDFYGMTKYQSELLVRHYSQYFSTTILRLFFPYGEGQVKGLFPLLINKIRNNQPVIIYNNENPKINPIYITDAIKVINKSINLDEHHTLNIAGNEIISVKNLAELIGAHLKSKPIFEPVCEKSVIDLIGDNTKMKKILGITPEVSLEQGIKIMSRDRLL